MTQAWQRIVATPRVGLPLALVLHVALAVLLGGFIVAGFDPAFSADGAATAAPDLVALNAVPTVLVALLLLGVTRRPWLSHGLVVLALYALYHANALKLEALDTPLLPVDFVLLGHLGDGAALLLHYLPRGTVAGVMAALAILLLLAWRERPWTRLRAWPRALLLGAAAALAATLALNTRPWSAFYAVDDDFKAWSPADSARNSGLPVTLLRYAWDMSFALPQPDRAAAAQLLQKHAPAASASGAAADLPDIVVLQSESFFDPMRLRGAELSQTLPEYRRLAAGTRHGDLWVPTFGGGTIRTEFEVLTGIAMRYFPSVRYPYFRLTAKAVPSLASVLAERGYATVAIHPNSRDFWNRAAALAHLGFEEFAGSEQFTEAERVGWYTSDDALVDRVLERLEAAQSPLFLFAISMENHGPYDDYPNADRARLAAQSVPTGLGDPAARRLRGYLYHLENADRALGRLADALRQRPRRTLLLFYGDHLPSLPMTYAQHGFDDGAPGADQPVPWLLLDTAQPPQARETESTASFYLPGLLLDAAGLGDRGYFDLLEAVRRDDRPGRRWVPAEDEGLRALMQLRQRGEFGAAAATPG